MAMVGIAEQCLCCGQQMVQMSLKRCEPTKQNDIVRRSIRGNLPSFALTLTMFALGPCHVDCFPHNNTTTNKTLFIRETHCDGRANCALFHHEVRFSPLMRINKGCLRTSFHSNTRWVSVSSSQLFDHVLATMH